MKASEFKSKVNSIEFDGTSLSSYKDLVVCEIDKMIAIIGDHEIPENDDKYGELIDISIGEDCSDSEAEKQMRIVRNILTYKKLYDIGVKNGFYN